MKTVFTFLFTSYFYSTFYCFSQNANKKIEWTLKQCVDYAVDHNLQIKRTALNVENTKQDLRQSQAQTLPNLNGFAAHNYNFGQTIDPYTNQFARDRVQSDNFALSSNITLFNGLQNFYNIQQNQMQLMAVKSDADKMRNDVALNITAAFLQVLLNEELLTSAKNQLNITKMQLERIQKMVNAGALPKAKLLETDAQMAMDELNVVNAENYKDLSYLTLKQLLDLEATTDFSIVKPGLLLPAEMGITSTPGQIYDAALTLLPEIKSGEYRLLGAEKTLKAVKGGQSPRLSLQGSLATGFSGLRKDVTSVTSKGYASTGYFTSSGEEVLEPAFDVQSKVRSFDKQIDDNFNKSVGVNLNIPVFNGLSVRTNIAKAKIAKQQAEYDLSLAKNQVQKNVQQAYSDAAAALKKYNATKKSADAFEELFKYADKRFSVGDMNAFEYNDAKNKFAKAQSDLLQAKYDFVFKQKILDFYQGKSLVF